MGLGSQKKMIGHRFTKLSPFPGRKGCVLLERNPLLGKAMWERGRFCSGLVHRLAASAI